MKQTFRHLLLFLMLTAFLLSAHRALTVAPRGMASYAQYTGVVQRMNGTQWVVDGKTIAVAPSTVKNEVKIGDTVILHVILNSNGTVTVLSVGAPVHFPRFSSLDSE